MRLSTTDLVKKVRDGIEAFLHPLVGPSGVLVGETRQVRPQRFPELVRACHPPIHRTSATVQRKPEPYWQEIGWQRRGDGLYEGYYRVNGHSYKGQVKQSGRGLDFYVIDPPRQIRLHPCFRHRGNGTFWVHWHGTAPGSISSGIMSVEYALCDVLV